MTRPVVAVLDYGIGNLRSAQKALDRVGADARLTADASDIASAAGVVLPGVGAFGRCTEALGESGLTEIARAAAAEASDGGRPFLGICVGLQLLYTGSDESPGVDGLGIVEGRVEALSGDVKRPQMQWNRLDHVVGHPLFRGIEEEAWAYFVHGYAAPVGPTTVATCEYGSTVCAAVACGNLWATQFHPEKSGEVGLQVLRNFVDRLAA
ncbi:MAG: imidazole glycerol phosphate synthase subunit HisH [Actinobacteria bacterium]|nr:imidazole glycerol phosphate synthase subunit HisH [Actinomycetota bacterium]